MREERMGAVTPRVEDPRGEAMKGPEEVAVMLRLHVLGWGAKRIGRMLGCSHHTVRRYLQCGGAVAYRRPARTRRLDGLEEWLRERFRRHRGNADVIRQELAAEKGMVVSLRTVERAVAPYRQALLAEARATLRFETPPGRQLQIDFGERLVEIGGVKVKVFLFVATLGYSRRLHVRAFRNERQESWFDGLESAFARFGGVPEEVLFDNARALVDRHDAVSREVVFNARLKAFARHWGFQPRACAPYRARTKGKTENGVGYVKKNAIAGRDFASWDAFEAHLEAWTREVADVRVHGTTGEPPLLRFRRDEAGKLKPLAGVPPFRAVRELVRVTVTDEVVRVFHGAREVAVHRLAAGRRQRLVDLAHFADLAGPRRMTSPADAMPAAVVPVRPPALLRALAEYEACIGGGF
jgi:transposase